MTNGYKGHYMHAGPLDVGVRTPNIDPHVHMGHHHHHHHLHRPHLFSRMRYPRQPFHGRKF